MSAGVVAYAVAALLGLVAAGRIVRAPRMGRASIGLALQLVAASFAAGMLAYGTAVVAPAGWASVLAPVLAALVLSTAGGNLFIAQLDRAEGDRGAARTPLVLAISAPLVVVGWMLLGRPWDRPVLPGERFLTMGAWAHLLGLQLLTSAVLTLQKLERAFRTREEHLRWQVKFPLLGVAFLSLAWVYAATKLLLYRGVAPAESAFASHALLVGALAILFGWGRLRDELRLKFSHRAAYSMLTLSVVGIYLLLTSVLVAVVGSFANAGAEVVAFFFLFLVAVLAAVLLSEEARQRTRDWLRRNLYLDRYDYRSAWIEADARIRAERGVDEAARALAQIAARALDALRVVVWVREGRTDTLRAAAVQGSLELREGETVEGAVPWFAGDGDDAGDGGGSAADDAGGVREGDRDGDADDDADSGGDDDRDDTRVRDAGDAPAGDARALLERCQAVLYLPLAAGGELLGLLTISRNLTRRAYSRETHEFLGVLGQHTARALHERRLRAAELDAREAEAFREFALFLLHDLKNFASTLSLVARNAATHADNPEFRRDAFDSVGDTADRMRRLCNTLRDFSVFSVQPDAERKPVDLGLLAREVVDEVDGAYPGRVSVESGDPVPVRANRDAIRSVVRNLVLNAAEALRDGEGGVHVSIRGEAGGCRLTVADDGVGIAPDFLEQELFRPFRTTKSDGLGIGLFQARRTVEAHGGRIAVASAPGEGTTVTVFLPSASGDSPGDRAADV